MSIILIWMHVGVMNSRVEAARSGLVQFFGCFVHTVSLTCPFVCLFMHPLTHASVH